jgi:hypothetical protein
VFTRFFNRKRSEDGRGTAPASAVGMRRIRRWTQILLTLVGTAVVLYAVLAVEATYNRVLVVVLGLILVEAGIWEFTRSLFPNEREFRPLRKETDYFLSIVRRMNRAAIRARADAAGAVDEVERLTVEMHHSVDRMRRLAGLSDEELGFRYKAGLEIPATLDPAARPQAGTSENVAARAG